MKLVPAKKRIRAFLKWVLWVFLAQFLIINISAAFYAYKLTHFYDSTEKPTQWGKENIFSKTWRLFSGPRFIKTPAYEIPHFLFEQVDLKTKNGINLQCWYMPVDSARGTVIMFHGLGLNKSMHMDQAYEYRYYGFNVMLVDMRAHGNSESNTTMLAISESEDVKLAYDFVAAKGEKNIILYGLSLGAVAVAKAVYDYDIKPSRVILDAPFESLKMHLKARARGLGFPEEPFATLVTIWVSIERGTNGFKHNTNKYVEKLSCPVLVQYGAKDKWVMNDEIQSIFKHISAKDKKLVIYPDADHEFYIRNDIERWRTEVGNFITQ